MSSKKDLASSRLVSKKEKIFNWIIFVLLLLGAVAWKDRRNVEL